MRFRAATRAATWVPPGVADEENTVEPARVQPLREGVGELGDVERVWRLSAAGEAG
ncbi:hypothetical protein [Blastococcus mobilis]|uniref:Uncharacterized protein n=1 Tax=Blastococcus mobilis TaxID=1938746 RepID=A0A238XDE3_9ACTN|nr:hypothetical protein [Blastococcus mobilis]SNR56354.1 hypothetical protein SAMN06272737_112154 [Blastococcus mobilis]